MKRSIYHFGINWGAQSEAQGWFNSKETVPVDLDLACMVIRDGVVVDCIYYGQKNSMDKVVSLNVDDNIGDIEGDDHKDNEIISIELQNSNDKEANFYLVASNYTQQAYADLPHFTFSAYYGESMDADNIIFQSQLNITAIGGNEVILARLIQNNGIAKVAGVDIEQSRNLGSRDDTIKKIMDLERNLDVFDLEAALRVKLLKMTPHELGESGKVEAIPILNQILKSGQVKNRRLAASAIKKLAGMYRVECESSIPYLLHNLESERPQTRQYVLQALQKLPQDAKTKLAVSKLAALDEKEYNRTAALDCLKLYKSNAVKDINGPYLYHITDKRNLATILEAGLKSHNVSHQEGLVAVDISLESANSKRNYPDKYFNISLHDYVPLYFNPRNAMMYMRQDQQEDILILKIKKQIMIDACVIYTDGNAASRSRTQHYYDLDGLSTLPWETILGNSWRDEEADVQSKKKRQMCAEVLIYPEVPVKYVGAIDTYSQEGEDHVFDLVSDTDIIVKTDREFYF